MANTTYSDKNDKNNNNYEEEEENDICNKDFDSANVDVVQVDDEMYSGLHI